MRSLEGEPQEYKLKFLKLVDDVFQAADTHEKAKRSGARRRRRTGRASGRWARRWAVN